MITTNEILFNIVTASDRGARGECHIGFPSLTFQSPEKGGNKPLKRRFFNKKRWFKLSSLFLILDSLIKIHPIKLATKEARLRRASQLVIYKKIIKETRLLNSVNLSKLAFGACVALPPSSTSCKFFGLTPVGDDPFCNDIKHI